MRGRAAVGDEAREIACGIEPRVRILDMVDVVMENVPGGLAQATAGQHVEAHVQNAVLREAFRGKREQSVAHSAEAPTNTRHARR